jgi:hypothetical protein
MLKQPVLLGFCISLSAGIAQPQTELQGELELKAASRTERDAGVWLDGQYVGFVDDLHGRDRLVLVPGPHEITFKLIGYQEVTHSITVEPGQDTEHVVSMQPSPQAVYPDLENTSRVRLKVEPENAAIFVNQKFIGHVDRFDGRRGMRIAPGTYRFTVALPGYEPFQTELTLRENQTYEIETKLPKGSLSDQAAELMVANPGVFADSD